MHIFVNLILVAIIIYNLNRRSRNIYQAKIPQVAIACSAILLIIGIGLWNTFDKTILGLLLAINFVLAFISSFIGAGIADNCIRVYDNHIPITRNIAFNDIKDISIEENESKFKIIYKAYGTDFEHFFDNTQKIRIINYLNSKIPVSIQV